MLVCKGIFNNMVVILKKIKTNTGVAITHFLAHPAFKPKMSLCHCVASVVCRLLSVICPQFTRNASPPSALIQFQFCLACLKELVPVH